MTLSTSTWMRDSCAPPSHFLPTPPRPAPPVAAPPHPGLSRGGPRVRQAPRPPRGEDVAAAAPEEQPPQAGVENPLRRHARIAAPEDRRERPLSRREVGQRLPAEGGVA